MAEGFYEHFAAHKREEAKGQPVIPGLYQVRERGSCGIAEQRHDELKQAECEGCAQRVPEFHVGDAYSRGNRNGERVHGQRDSGEYVGEHGYHPSCKIDSGKDFGQASLNTGILRKCCGLMQRLSVLCRFLASIS